MPERRESGNTPSELAASAFKKLLEIFRKTMFTSTWILMGAVLGISQVDGNFHDRVKRQAAIPTLAQWIEAVTCCPFPMVLTIDSKTGCFTQPPLVPGGPMMPNWVNQACDIECAFKKQGLVNSGNSVETSALSNRVAELAAANPAWATVIKEAFNSCTKDNPPVLQPSSQCTSGAGEMSQCFSGYMLVNCPTGMADPSPKCAETLNGYKVFMSG